MSLRKCLPFAILFTLVALVVLGGVSIYRAKVYAPKLNTQLHAPMPAVAALPGYGNQTANRPNRWIESFRGRDELLPASLVPIQFKDPNELGAGKLLVASRNIGDPNFAQSVILLVHYDEKGVVGLILNRRTDVPISRVFDLKAAKDRSDPVYVGGPVQLSTVFALFHSSAKMEKAQNIFDGVYLISDKDLFEKILASRPGPGVFHVYLGYAGWTQAQLQNEVRLGAWYILPADTAAIFNSDPDSLWLQMIHKTDLQWAEAEPLAEISRPVEKGAPPSER